MTVRPEPMEAQDVLGERYEAKYLLAYAEHLLFYTASFDVENIRKTPDGHPGSVAGIEKLESE